MRLVGGLKLAVASSCTVLANVVGSCDRRSQALRIVISISVRTQLSRFCPSKLTYPGLGISNWGCERFGWYCPLCVVRPGIPLVALRIPDLGPVPELAVLSV